MKHRRRLGLLAGSLVLGTAVLFACGDDDAVLLATLDGGGSDGSLDSRSPTGDATSSDARSNDARGDDDDDGGDGGTEGGGELRDAQADVDLPEVDAGDPTIVDAGDLAREFPARLAAEMCRSVARCCFGDSETQPDGGVDGGRYDSTKCTNLYLVNGVNRSTPAGADYDKLEYNSAKAAECLGRIRVLACNSNAAEYRALVASCYAVLEGKGGAGASCAVTGECQSGFFCNTAVGGGTCEALRTTGAACGDWTSDQILGQNTCSNRFSNAPPRFCASLTDGGGTQPTGDWKCADALPNGARCFNTTYCATGICSVSPGPARFTCQDFAENFNATACDSFVAK